LYVCFQGMCYFYPEDGGNMFLWNMNNHLCN
jgi:hypothetical protein